MKRTYRAAVALVMLGLAPPARPGLFEDKVVSPFNQRALSLARRPARYSVFLVGHLYGSQNQSIYPAASALANLDRFSGRRLKFGVLLGDILRQPEDLHIGAFTRSFAERVAVPLFAVIGNHDEGREQGFQRHFGAETFYAFRYSSELFVFLDGERDDGDIVGLQLEFLRQQIGRAASDEAIRNLFIFCHRLVWAIGNPPIDRIVPFINGPESHRADALSFTNQALPALRALGKPVYLVSGDVGGAWSFPLFFQADASADITYIATGIGDTADDTVLIASIDRGEVSFAPVSLTGRDAITAPLSQYGVDFWVREMTRRRAGESQ